MSYDVWMKADLGGPSLYVIDENINHTSNTSRMWREAGADLLAMDGMSGEECIPLLERAIRDINDRLGHYATMAPSNGWGTVDSTIGFLGKILDQCRRMPRAFLVVSA